MARNGRIISLKGVNPFAKRSARPPGPVTAIDIDGQTLRVVQGAPKGDGLALTKVASAKLDLAPDADRADPTVMGRAIAKALNEPGVVSLSTLAVASLIYQTVLVGFASYLVWFWLLSRYLAARLSVMSFLTPMFGVLSGVLLLSESLSARFVLAALLVGGGIVLVNLRK